MDPLINSIEQSDALPLHVAPRLCFSMSLGDHLCFPLYATFRVLTKLYKPFLDDLDLTYPQYIVMVALWEQEELTVKELGDLLYLDSGTLSPLLKKLEKKAYIRRIRGVGDDRKVVNVCTDVGMALKHKASRLLGELLAQVPDQWHEAEEVRDRLKRFLARLITPA